MTATCSRLMLLTAGQARLCLDDQARAGIVGFLDECLLPDGSARGRDGRGDLYYTLFALAALQALKAPVPRVRVLRYLKSFQTGDGLDFVHRACLARMTSGAPATPATRRSILQGLEVFRAGDGGYHHQHRQADHGSAYGAFLAWLAYEDLNETPPDREGLLHTVRAHNAETANTTNLAATTCILHQAGEAIPADTAAWILARQAAGGGFRAHGEAPVDDLLSTAVALFALSLIGSVPTGCREGCLDLVEACWRDNNGFAGARQEAASDAEYTFYALLALGCLMK